MEIKEGTKEKSIPVVADVLVDGTNVRCRKKVEFIDLRVVFVDAFDAGVDDQVRLVLLIRRQREHEARYCHPVIAVCLPSDERVHAQMPPLVAHQLRLHTGVYESIQEQRIEKLHGPAVTQTVLDLRDRNKPLFVRECVAIGVKESEVWQILVARRHFLFFVEEETDVGGKFVLLQRLFGELLHRITGDDELV